VYGKKSVAPSVNSAKTGIPKNFLLQVVHPAAAPVFVVAGRKLGNIILLLEFYHVNPTAKSYSAVAKTMSKTDKLAKVLEELKFDEMLKRHPVEHEQVRKITDRYLDTLLQQMIMISKRFR
jgi:hypothetical protein